MKIPELRSRILYTLSLLFIALSTVLLMAPAAYHRIVDEGETTEQLHRFASVMNLSALVTLALGMAGDVVIVARKVTDSETMAWSAGGGLLLLCYGIWFGYSLACRDRHHVRDTVARG